MSIAEVEHNLLRCVDTDTPPSTLHITPLYPPRKIALHLEPTPAPPPAHSAAMSRPSTVLTKIPAPTTQFPGLALTQRDFRLNFCINNGSLSMLPYVPVYDVDRLDAQLDDMTSRLLEDAVEIDMNKRIVVLPKVPTHALDAGPGLLPLCLMRPRTCPYARCAAGTWQTLPPAASAPSPPAQVPTAARRYARPIRPMGCVRPALSCRFQRPSARPRPPPSAQPVPVDSLRVLVHYFKREEKEKIVRLLLDSTPPNVKFRHPNFRCRVLTAEDAVVRSWDRYRSASTSEPHDARHHRSSTFDEQHRHPSF